MLFNVEWNNRLIKNRNRTLIRKRKKKNMVFKINMELWKYLFKIRI